MLEGYDLNETKEMLKRFHIRPSKGLGQNFLTDKNVLGKILTAAEISHGSQVLEVGPGIGTLTRVLASTAQKVVAVELDKGLLPALEHALKPFDNVEVINADILTLDLKALWEGHFTKKVNVVANLPYYITSPIIMKLLEGELPIENIVVMVQKEVAHRMNACPGVKDYGTLSIAVQYRSQVNIIEEVPPEVFIPHPKVVSAIIKMNIIEADKRCPVKDERLLFRLVKAAFGQRRKTLLNALGGGFDRISRQELTKALEECNIASQRRGETLSIEEFCCLADYLYDNYI